MDNFSEETEEVLKNKIHSKSSDLVVKRYKKIGNLFANRKIGKKETPKNKRT